jgi:Flp pilus assembly pilin Flp
MKTLTLLQNFWKEEHGQDMVEYVIILAFVAVAAAAIIVTSSASVSTIWSVTNSELSVAASVGKS